ncbi:MAG: 4Fe-4S binding protein [Deltaproteobacteria bacterium]|nr:4Fe-4S binding protein [Deltaproteobacteria bacterium]
MLDIILARARQKHRTMAWPDGPAPPLPARFLGRPVLAPGSCPAGCQACRDVCPTRALAREPELCLDLSLDLGRCLFCGECAAACPAGRISFSQDYRLATSRREDLLLRPGAYPLAGPLDPARRRLFGRSLNLREVSAGGCNACEADTNVLGTIGWDLGRFGVHFAASPRHADGLLITGPVPENMHLALLKTYEATPSPKVAIVVGSCAIAGGPFAGHQEVCDGAAGLLPVDLFIPGCPPHPLTILDGLLRLLGRLPAGEGTKSL